MLNVECSMLNVEWNGKCVSFDIDHSTFDGATDPIRSALWSPTTPFCLPEATRSVAFSSLEMTRTAASWSPETTRTAVLRSPEATRTVAGGPSEASDHRLPYEPPPVALRVSNRTASTAAPDAASRAVPHPALPPASVAFHSTLNIEHSTFNIQHSPSEVEGHGLAAQSGCAPLNIQHSGRRQCP